MHSRLGLLNNGTLYWESFDHAINLLLGAVLTKQPIEIKGRLGMEELQYGRQVSEIDGSKSFPVLQ